MESPISSVILAASGSLLSPATTPSTRLPVVNTQATWHHHNFRGRDQEDATELFVCLGKGPALKSAIIVQHLKTES
jgi:hypothetical protein